MSPAEYPTNICFRETSPTARCLSQSHHFDNPPDELGREDEAELPEEFKVRSVEQTAVSMCSGDLGVA
jgi:hypothetical protein